MKKGILLFIICCSLLSCAWILELYENQPELINLSDRSLTILLEHE